MFCNRIVLPEPEGPKIIDQAGSLGTIHLVLRLLVFVFFNFDWMNVRDTLRYYIIYVRAFIWFDIHLLLWLEEKNK